MIGMGLKYNHIYPYKRDRGGFAHTRRRQDMKMEQRDLKILVLVRVMCPQTKECWKKLPEAGRDRNVFSEGV